MLSTNSASERRAGPVGILSERPPEGHVPVLLDESIAWLSPGRGGVFVDATVGLGGHASEILRSAPGARVVGIDRDPEALEQARSRLAQFEDRVQLVEGRFGDLEDLLERLGIGTIAGIVADLGVSSLQLDSGARGFSFRRDGPLDMRMGREGQTAAEVVALYPEEELVRILREYGEERMARRIARAVVRAREAGPIETTRELQEIVARAARGPRGKGRIDPATRTFQALRIEVNQELQEVETLLSQALRLVEPDGRMVVISYHSLEDRLVKRAFVAASRGETDSITGQTVAGSRVLEMLTRRPVRPTVEEVARNPRSRSARLRAARRL